MRVLACVLLVASMSVRAAEPSPVPDDDPRVASALELARAWLDAERAYEQVPGVSAAIVHDQKVLWSGAFGLADVATGRKAEAGTIYSICSISKLFTSIAVMQLRDAGKLRLDDAVRFRLPWFTMKPGGTDGTEITIEGLLTHAAGLPRETDLPYWTGPTFPFPTHEQIVARLAQQTALYPAETYFQYSNLGLTLAGEIVSALSGVSYGDYVSKNILIPLKLASTTSEMPEPERGKRLARGYSALTRAGGRDPVAFFQGKAVAPAMAFASTAEDLARFASWQFRLLGGGGPEVLKTATLREMHRVHFVDPDFETMWGLGFQVSRSDKATLVGHGGSCPGFRTHLMLQPEEKLGIVVLTNASGVDAEGWAEHVREILAPALKAAAKEPGKGKTPMPELRKFAGTYSGAPWGGETFVLPWEDGLAMLSLPSRQPMKDLIRMKRTGDLTFRRIRKDDTLGEEIVFALGPDGKATRFTRHSNYSVRVD
ncbi:MAG: serine hydrolase [Acidobacteriota bacterium]|nr:serine hydrolase [Acidobacteriota bacterium]